MLLHYRSSITIDLLIAANLCNKKYQLSFTLKKGIKIDKSITDSADVQVLNIQEKISLLGGSISDKLINTWHVTHRAWDS
jgi:hypothetical protein